MALMALTTFSHITPQSVAWCQSETHGSHSPQEQGTNVLQPRAVLEVISRGDASSSTGVRR